MKLMAAVPQKHGLLKHKPVLDLLGRCVFRLCYDAPDCHLGAVQRTVSQTNKYRSQNRQSHCSLGSPGYRIEMLEHTPQRSPFKGPLSCIYNLGLETLSMAALRFLVIWGLINLAVNGAWPLALSWRHVDSE